MQVRHLFPALLLVCAIWVVPARAVTPAIEQTAPRTSHAWIYADLPAWDISNEGLPFRFTLALPSQRDPLTRLLLAEEARWTFSVGYAKVYNSYDAATGVFKNSGGHAALFSAGREFRWKLPPVLGSFTPRPFVEFGVHYATHRFPADGSRANFKLISGLEWVRETRRDHEWSVAVIWQHYSNANLRPRNAGYDGIGVRLGRRIRF